LAAGNLHLFQLLKLSNLRLLPYLLILLVGCTAGLAAMVALPHDKFLRYQGLNDSTAPTAYWIYERIHTDPSPIDIAFIGTSRIGLSMHSSRLEADLRRLGVSAKAANLHIVKTGVNMQYVVAKELLEARHVKLLVIEMTEWEDRKPHPDFIFLADTWDVLAAPTIVNLNYFSDLVRLPGRQADLFFQTQRRRLRLDAPSFVPPYEGPNLDHAEFIQTLDGRRHERLESYTQAEMDALRKEQERLTTPPLLPTSLNEFEFHLTRYYTRRILDLAKAHHTSVVFLYTPRYGGPAQPIPYQRYANRADLINPWAQVQDYALWWDGSHVNWEGAKRMTDFVALALASRKELR
jgi:hypothetical protein